MSCPFRSEVAVTPRIARLGYAAVLNLDASTEVKYESVEKSFVATCPFGTIGTPVSVTIPAGTYVSYQSQEIADKRAQAVAKEQAEANLSCRKVDYILFASTGPQDDDVRLTRLRPVVPFVISDTRLNIGWYNGLTQLWFPPATGTKNAIPFSSGFRQVIIPGTNVVQGDVITVDLFDGWSGAYRASPWTATIYWADGNITVKSGGTSFTGVSPVPLPIPLPGNYYDVGPHFLAYFPNGSFTVTP